MAMQTATTMAIKVPEDVLEILVYHSGKNRNTTITDKIIGNPNIVAIGSPPINFLANELSLSLLFFQYSTNDLSFGESILQI